jgi:ABC-2 type transport system permease protein
MSAILRIAIKDLRLLIRDRFGLFWVLVFPLLMALFFGAIFGGGGGGRGAMKVMIVDQDQSDYSRRFIESLDASEAIRVVPADADSARGIVRRGRAVAYLILKKGAGDFENLFGADSATMVVGLDPARRAEAGYLQGLIVQAWFAVLQEDFLDPKQARPNIQEYLGHLSSDSVAAGSDVTALTDFFGSLDGFLAQLDTGVLSSSGLEDTGTKESDSATGATVDDSGGFGPRVDFEAVTIKADQPRTAWEITFPQALLWALIGCAAAFAISLVVERTAGTMLRLRLAPISRAQILAGKGLACFIFCVSVCTILLMIGKFVFDVRTPQPLFLVEAVVAAGICFVGLMMLISVLGKTEQAVGGAGWAILLVMSMTGGGMVPLMFMPEWMVTLSHLSPVKWGILALEGAIWRGFTQTEMLLPLGVLTGIGVVAFATGVTVLKATDK